MNSKMLYGAALSALMLTACSQDNVLDQPARTDAISFAVTNGATSRAAQSFCNTSMPESFKVSAYRINTNEPYFVEDVAARQGNSTVYTSTPERYWPEGMLTFHAWVNDCGTYKYENGAMHFNDFAPAQSVKDQVDLIYAVAAEQTKTNDNVKLNFRHPLSQIVFSARNEAKSYTVSVSGVTVGHLNNKGTYVNYLKASTDENYENHTWNQNGQEDKILKGQGMWTLNGNLQRYSVGFGNVNLQTAAKDKNGNVVLTDVDHNGNSDGSMILLPQEQGKWEPGNAAKTEKDTQGYNGAYFLLDVVFNDANNGSEIYSGPIAVPVDVEWEQGHRYRYTFVFTDNGAGGYIPDPENPQPVLLGVKYDVTTDDFVPVVNPDINPGNNPGGNVDPKPENTFTLSIKDSDGTDFITPLTYKGTETSHTFTLPAVANPTKEGFTFAGWQLNLDNKVYSELPSSFTVNSNASTVVYTAVWNKVEAPKYVYELIFDGNNPSQTLTVEGVPAKMVSSSVEAESYEFTIPDATPAVGNWTFQGWAETPNANLDTPTWKAGEKYTVSKDKKVVTLYAVWGTKFTGGSTPGAGGTGY